MRTALWIVMALDVAGFVTDHDDPELWAIRPDGTGDVTGSHVAWKATQGIPSRSSPLLVDDLLYVISHQGILSCLDAKTGEVVWKNRVEGKSSASPIHAANRICFFNGNAVCTVIRPGRKFEQLAVNRLSEQPLMASPAVAGDSLFTEGHLIATITANLGKISHFHVADVPGRHQPGTGEINYLNVFRAIAAAGFTGFLGLEMWPTVDPTQAVRESISLLAEATAERK